MQEHEAFLQAIQKQPFSAALILGNLLASKNTKQLKQIKSKIKHVHLDSMVHAIIHLPKHQKRSLDPDAIVLLSNVCQILLKEPSFGKPLSQASILLLGQDEQRLRWALYRLIQNGHPNKINIPEALLDSFGTEHTAHKVSKKYEVVNHLPLEAIQQLATTKEAAHTILMDLRSHPNRFELAQCLIERHPALAKELAKQWRQEIKAQPKTKPEKKSLQSVCNKLEDKHPEFKKIATTKRRKRIAKNPKSSTGSSISLEKIAFGGWLTLNLLTPSSPVTLGLSALKFSAQLAGPYVAYQAGQFARHTFASKEQSIAARLPQP